MDYRHGDVLLRRIKKIPKGAKSTKNRVLAEGEVTGHKHEVIGDAQVYEKDGVLYLQAEKCNVTHEEHKTFSDNIVPGAYVVEYPVEYDYVTEELQRVAD